MKGIAFIVLLVFISVFISCNHKRNKEDIFQNVPIANTKIFIDSLAGKIWLDAGQGFTGRPTLKKNEHYYDERNFRDSEGNVEIYSIIDCPNDTIQKLNSYYYYK